MFIVLVVAVAIASRIDLNYYAIQPGTAQSVQQFITVPADKAHPVPTRCCSPTWRSARVSALDYLFFRLQCEHRARLGAGRSPGARRRREPDAQGALEMSQAESCGQDRRPPAPGYTVTATPAGAVMAGDFAGTPAFAVLNVGDVITAVDGTPTLTAEALTAELAHLPLRADHHPHGRAGRHRRRRSRWR